MLNRFPCRRVCIPGRITNLGGPASFQRKLTEGLKRIGVEATFDLDDLPYDAVLVINATRQIKKLWRIKRQGIRIVQRLGGINRLHRYLTIGWKVSLYSEIRNYLMRLIRACLADHVVYQSQFVKDMWERRYGLVRKGTSIINNGVDLDQFHPEGPRYRSPKGVCILSVEGTQGADPFDIAVNLAQGLHKAGMKFELLMFGQPLPGKEQTLRHPLINFQGPVNNGDLPYFYRGATLFVSTDLISAGCPNSVIEALACGAPVIGYQAGVLPEMLDESSGRCVPVQGDPWKGQHPGNLGGMLDAALAVASNWDRFRQGGPRRLAEERYGLDKMAQAYLKALMA